MKTYDLVLPLIKAVKITGSQRELARRCDTSQQHIFNMINRNKKASASYVLKIEAATNGEVPRHEIRPDLYPPP